MKGFSLRSNCICFDFGVTVDQKFVSKSCSCVRNIKVGFNALSKSGFEIEIRQLLAEILIINPEKSWFFRRIKNLKNQEFSGSLINISASSWRISIPRPDLERALNSTFMFLTHEHDLKTNFWSTVTPKSKQIQFDRSENPFNSNFFHYFFKIIYENLRLKWGWSTRSRVLSSVP